jgi:flavin reductase (DIM6/NTAB) family NADH-FMN oxidoreductase RutF
MVYGSHTRKRLNRPTDATYHRATTTTTTMTTTTPWPMTRVPTPVYSLATRDSMNVVTFATPVAIEPKRRFAIALYADTRSHANFIVDGGPATLQVLRKDAHEGLIDLLGRTRADSIDGKDGKLNLIRARASTTRRETNGVEVLSDALAVFDLEIMSVTNAGDHDVVICDVMGWACGDEEEMRGKCLTTLDVV